MPSAPHTNSILPPVLELDMLSYLTVDKTNTFPSTVAQTDLCGLSHFQPYSLSLTRRGIFSLIWCLPGVPVWLGSSCLSILIWANGLLSGNGVQRRVRAVPCACFPFHSSHLLRLFSPSDKYFTCWCCSTYYVSPLPQQVEKTNTQNPQRKRKEKTAIVVLFSHPCLQSLTK